MEMRTKIASSLGTLLETNLSCLTSTRRRTYYVKPFTLNPSPKKTGRAESESGFSGSANRNGVELCGIFLGCNTNQRVAMKDNEANEGSESLLKQLGT